VCHFLAWLLHVRLEHALWSHDASVGQAAAAVRRQQPAAAENTILMLQASMQHAPSLVIDLYHHCVYGLLQIAAEAVLEQCTALGAVISNVVG
jgi:hypothetical protein